jgi:hypothetical protein
MGMLEKDIYFCRVERYCIFRNSFVSGASEYIIRLNEPGVAGMVLEERHEGGCKSIF